MIAADVLSGDDLEVKRFAKFFVNTDEVQAQDSFVTYDVFARTYWPHFPQPLTKGLGMSFRIHEFSLLIWLHDRTLARLLRVYGYVVLI